MQRKRQLLTERERVACNETRKHYVSDNYHHERGRLPKYNRRDNQWRKDFVAQDCVVQDF